MLSDFTDHIVATQNGETPTPENSKLINGVKGRGSIIFVNQTSVFQYAELGSTVASDAAKQGAPYNESMPRFNVNVT